MPHELRHVEAAHQAQCVSYGLGVSPLRCHLQRSRLVALHIRHKEFWHYGRLDKTANVRHI